MAKPPQPPSDGGTVTPIRAGLRAVPTSKGGAHNTNADNAPWINKTEAARLLGMNPSSIHDFGRAGSPGVRTGKDGGVNLGKQRLWDIERAYERGKKDGAASRADPDGMSLDEVKAKREMIGLIEDERKLATSDAHFIPAPVVESRYGRILGRIAAEMLTLSVRVETDLEMALSPEARREVIDDAVKAIIVTMRTDAIIMGTEKDEGSFESMTEDQLEKELGPGEEERADPDKFRREAEGEEAGED